MVEIPGMLMVGAGCKSDGKTALTCTLIKRFGSRHDIVAVKVTTVDRFNTNHHPEITDSRSSDGCIGPYYITEEKDATSNTDTSRMFGAGAKRVLWVRSLKSHLEQSLKVLLENLGEETVSICESNRARSVIEPGVFIMVKGFEDKSWKPSAREVVEQADRVVLSDGTGVDMDLNDIQLLNRRWTIGNINTKTEYCELNEKKTGAGIKCHEIRNP